MHIVQVASEVAPMAKIGGLADVMMGLSRELSRLDYSSPNTVDVFLPNYDCLDTSAFFMSGQNEPFQSYFEGSWHKNSMLFASYNNEFQIKLIDAHHLRSFFKRGGIYGFPDDVDRFLYFCRAVVDWLRAKPAAPDVIHIHDWETAAIAALIKEKEYKNFFKKTRVIFTIHNIEYQGWCTQQQLENIGISVSSYPGFQMQDAFNLMKGGIEYSDFVTTVSPNYAKEVLTPEGGRGLEGILRKRKKSFCGILNGIDTTFWNPETDPRIAFSYSLDRIEDKIKNKHDLQTVLGMEHNDEKPLVISVARLVPQKGIHLIEHAIRESKGKYQFILLGSPQDPAVRKEFEELQDKHNKSPDIRIVLQIREDLAHKMYAASDFCLVPSLFEPCGLVQLIALRFGSVPIVRRTGGLLDTIHDGVNGLCFDYPDTGSIDWVMDRALQLFHDKKKWSELVKHCMACNYSWKKPAIEYLALYTGQG